MVTWKIRDGNAEDMEGILLLRKIVFGEFEADKLQPEFWRWEFLKGPDGKAFIYIVEDSGRIIGHFSDIPRRFSVNGAEVLGAFCADLMVHPDYRRRGIYEQMGRYATRRVKSEGGLFHTTCPIRPKTIRGLIKIGWKEVAKLPVIVYPIKFSGIANRYLHFLPLSFLVGGVARFFYTLFFSRETKKEIEGIEIEKVERLDDEFDRFWKKAVSLYPNMGVRDRGYMTWRYLQNPTRTYTIYRAMKRGEMKGFIVLRKVALLEFNSAVIVDLLALDEDILIALVKEGILYSQKVGVDLLGFMVPKCHAYYKALRHCGFIPSFKTFLFMIYSHAIGRELFDPKAWYVNWGDTEVI